MALTLPTLPIRCLSNSGHRLNTDSARGRTGLVRPLKSGRGVTPVPNWRKQAITTQPFRVECGFFVQFETMRSGLVRACDRSSRHAV
jgi:hypothetical protein